MADGGMRGRVREEVETTEEVEKHACYEVSEGEQVTFFGLGRLHSGKGAGTRKLPQGWM